MPIWVVFEAADSVGRICTYLFGLHIDLIDLCEVKCPTVNLEDVRVVGSVPELGSWRFGCNVCHLLVRHSVSISMLCNAGNHRERCHLCPRNAPTHRGVPSYRKAQCNANIFPRWRSVEIALPSQGAEAAAQKCVSGNAAVPCSRWCSTSTSRFTNRFLSASWAANRTCRSLTGPWCNGRCSSHSRVRGK